MSSNIQNDILTTILARLNLAEVMSVAAVGGWWSDIVRTFVNDDKLTVRHRSWLVLSDNPLKDTVALLNPLRRLTSDLDRRFCGALGDWIAISDNFDGLYLFHPLRRPNIPLPPVTTLPNHSRLHRLSPHIVNKVILSSPQPSAGCVVAIIFGDGELAFCRLGDTRWTEFEPDIGIERRYQDACFYNGELVVVDSDEFVWAIGFSPGLTDRRVIFEPPSSWNVHRFGFRHLVESMGQLLMVIRKRRLVWTRVGLSAFDGSDLAYRVMEEEFIIPTNALIQYMEEECRAVIDLDGYLTTVVIRKAIHQFHFMNSSYMLATQTAIIRSRWIQETRDQ